MLAGLHLIAATAITGKPLPRPFLDDLTSKHLLTYVALRDSPLSEAVLHSLAVIY